MIAAFVWALNLLGQVTFPSPNFVPFLIRSGITACALIVLLLTNLRSLKESDLPASSLGLQLSAQSLKSFLLGIIIGSVAMITMGLLVYVFVPYHFTHGPISNVDVFKNSFSYLLGNTVEELIFRAF
ncbi:MAG TPA: hypothetical protein VFE54_06710, partial [Mucilaginibacter sp.]|nr:hypothetical protein [Mucilaginibacter sp.]